jgi:hypothetical protein
VRVYEKHPTADAYRVGRAYVPYAIVAVDKRFTEAELAATYWFEYSLYVSECANILHCQERHMPAAVDSFKDAERKCKILHRFATLPSYDEES